jgi:hypothetical protein
MDLIKSFCGHLEDIMEHMLVCFMHHKSKGIDGNMEWFPVECNAHRPRIGGRGRCEDDSGCLRTPLTDIFGYVVEDSKTHLLE